MSDNETPADLIQRWRRRAADMENGDGAGKLAAYNLRFAADELQGVLPVCTCPASTLFSGTVGRDCAAHS